MFFRAKRSGDREYLQLVESERVEGRVRQRVLASLGRMDELRVSGQLARLTEELEAVRLSSELEARSAKSVGGRLVVERMWSELGLDVLLRRVARGRKMEFDLERAVFAMVANRVLDPGASGG